MKKPIKIVALFLSLLLVLPIIACDQAEEPETPSYNTVTFQNPIIMAKLYGISGKATGKKGDTVFAVRNGEQIIRQYNPIVGNPKTEAQVDNRAKLKLLSQLAAVCAPVLAISRKGAVSPRNIFTSINFPSVNAEQGVADIKLENLQITNSHVGMADFNIVREAGQPLAVALDTDNTNNYSHD